MKGVCLSEWGTGPLSSAPLNAPSYSLVADPVAFSFLPRGYVSLSVCPPLIHSVPQQPPRVFPS